MKVKQILTGVELVIADLEVELNGSMRSSHTLCALLKDDANKEVLIPNKAFITERGYATF